MSGSEFKVEQLDHVHVYVADQYEAARWYARVLGLEILKEFEDWAADGPLTISSDGGGTSLALFKESGEEAKARRRTTIAFRVGGEGFLAFLDRLETHPVQDASGRPLTPADVEDHDRSFSVYFCDPDGNPYELTTYDYEHVRERLRSNVS